MIKLNNVASFWLNFTYYKIVTHDYLFSHPTPRITLFVRSLVRNKISAASYTHAP